MYKALQSVNQEWISLSFLQPQHTKSLRKFRSGTVTRTKKFTRKYSQPLDSSNIEMVDLLSDGDNEKIFLSEVKPSSSKVSRSLQNVNYESLPLIDQFAPTSVDQLAVHTKKIAEVKDWLITHKNAQRQHKILLLLGPCGSGKTATVKALCNQLKYELTEWESRDCYEIFDEEMGEKSVRELSQAQTFEDFLKTANLGSLTKKHAQKVIMIEHIPNAFYREPDKLYELLRRYTTASFCIFVIVMSAVDSSWYLNPRRIFPSRIVNELQMDTINFNSSAVTLLQKALRRIITELKITATPTQIKRIAESSNGDIRIAINNLQISLGNGGRLADIPLYSSSSHLDVFHSIGKLLYAKRTEEVDIEWNTKEERLSGLLRSIYKRPYPPKDNVEKILDKSGMTGEKLSSFIHEHELAFVEDLDSIRKIFDNMSSIDCMSRGWEVRSDSALTDYEAQVAARSTLFYNYGFKHHPKRLYNFSKPKWDSIRSTCNGLRKECLTAFPQISSDDLFTMVIPALAVIENAEVNFCQQQALSLMWKDGRFGCCMHQRFLNTSHMRQKDAEEVEVFEIEEVEDSD